MHDGLLEIARQVRIKDVARLPEPLAPDRHQGQSPPVFVRAFLLLAALVIGLVLMAVLFVMWLSRPLGERVPSYSLLAANRLTRPVTAFNVVTDREGRGVGLVVADDQSVHYGRTIKDLLQWWHLPLAELEDQLPAPKLVGLHGRDGRLALVCEREDGICRGLTLGQFPANWRDLRLWAEPVWDTSYFPGLDDRHAHCLLRDPKTGLVLVGARGLGAYDPATSRWLPPLLPGTDGLSSQEVYDLEQLPDGQLAVLGDGGIDLGRLAVEPARQLVTWTRSSHHDQTTGLAGTDVRHGRLLGTDLVYVTAGGGLGRLPLDAASRVLDPVTLVGEGRAPGLTRTSLQRASEDRARGAVWMVHEVPDPTDHQAAALYQTQGHQLLATAPDAAWPKTATLALTADPHEPAPTAWLGTRGLRRLEPQTDATTGQTQIQVAPAGLPDCDVDEIAVHPHAVLAHAVREGVSGDRSPHTIEAATRQQLTTHDAAAWAWPFIGPRRFPGLTMDDLTAACDAEFENQSAIYFGTRDKGIGVFLRGTRELFVAHRTDHRDPRFRVPFDGTLDLAAQGRELVQVSAGRAVAYFNGQRWVTVMAEGGIPIDPATVTTVVADGPRLVIGSADKIGGYDTTTHQWQEIPPLPDLQRLALGIGRLWGLDKNQKLFSFPLPAAAGSTWAPEDQNVIDFYGDSELVAVLTASERMRRLSFRLKDGTKLKPLVAVRGLPGQPATGERWQVAAVAERTLYVAPHTKGIGRYDLASHAWSLLPFPPEASGDPRQLLATPAGLWLLAGNSNLYFLAQDETAWERAAQEVKWVSCDGREVILLGQSGGVQRSTAGATPLATLVGDAFADQLAQVKAAAVFQQQLFVGTTQRVGRYEVSHHAWHNYEEGLGIVQFAPTEGFLYARSATGGVRRWVAADDSWDDVPLGDENARAKQLAASGGPALLILLDSGAVLAVLDTRPQNPVTLVAASRLGEGAITAGAEVGRGLYVGLDNGRVAGFDKAANQPWVWSQLLDGGSEPIRQLLVASAAPPKLVALGERAWLLRADGPDGNWQSSVLLDRAGLDGAVDAGHFYGLENPGSGQAQIWRVPFDPQPATPVAYLGQPFPASPRPATAAIGATPTPDIFRADEGGHVAQYDVSENGWKEINLQNVQEFLRVGPQLWAWAPADRTLYQWQTGAWNAADQQAEHVVGDGQALLLARTGGEVVLRTDTGDTTLIPSRPVDPLPVGAVEEIQAAAEQGEWLFLGVKRKNLLAYQRAQHAWRVDDLQDVAEFCRVTPAAGTAALFCRTGAGTVHRGEPATGTWAAVALPGGATAAKLVASDGHLAVLTAAGAIHLADAAGNIVGSFQPQLLADRKAADFQLRAAAESGGRLFLIPERPAGNDELWCYDPATHAWQVEPITVPGRPQRFLEAGGLWLVLADPQAGLRVAAIGNGTPLIQAAVEGLVDVASDGTALWAVTADHHVRHVGRDGNLVPSGLPEVALPEGRTVQQAFAVADQCGVMLDDGSVWHYATTARAWEQRVPPPAAGPAKTDRVLPVGQRHLLLIRADGSTWSCDPATGQWEPVPPDADAKVPELPPNLRALDWKITGASPNYTFAVQVDGEFQTRTLDAGRFDWDVPEQIVAEPDTVWLKTVDRTLKYQRPAAAAGGKAVWQAVPNVEQKFPKPAVDALVFAGPQFAGHRDPAGAFPTATTPVAILLTIGKEQVVLKPGATAGGAGFAHDVVRDLAASGGDLWLATPGGAVRLTGLPKPALAEIAGPTAGLTDDDLVALVAVTKGLLVRTRSGGYARRLTGPVADQWLEVPVELGAAGFARAAAEERDKLLDHWRIDPADPQLQLILGAPGDPRVPVSLDGRGFGFDRPQAFALTPHGVRLWTADGRVDLARTPGPPLAVEPQQRCPQFTGFGDVLEESAGATVWLRSRAADPAAWTFDGRTWQPATLADFRQQWAARYPNHWQDPQLTWDRQDTVTFQVPVLNRGRPFATRFDPDRGQFLLNVPFDIEVAGEELWAATAGGLVRFDADKRWADVSPRAVPADDPPRLLYLPKLKRLIAVVGGRYEEWTGTAWQTPADVARITDALRRGGQFLVDGENWQVERRDAQAAARRMRARLTAAPTFATVTLGADGRFDFERVNDVADEAAAAHCATASGLGRLDIATAEYTNLWEYSAAAERLGWWQGRLYARLTSGQVLEYQSTGNLWVPTTAATVFPEIDKRLVDTPPWTWMLDLGRHRVVLQKQDKGIWDEAQPLPVGLPGDRFDFDTVYDVGQLDQPWLVTDAGLLARRGEGLVGITRPVPFQRRPAGERSLLSVTSVATPQLFAQTAAGGLLECQGGAWNQMSTGTAQKVQALAQTQVARSAWFDVSQPRFSPAGTLRPVTDELAVGLHLPDDPGGLYKTVAFDPTEGLFTFDDLQCVTRQAGGAVGLLVGTLGGVARYLPEDPDDAAFRRLFCDPAEDGIGRVAVGDILLGKRDPANLLAARPTSGGSPVCYRLHTDRWQADTAARQVQQQYNEERKIIAWDPAAWQVRDRTEPLAGPSSSDDFEMQWRQQIVRLADLRQTGDAATAITRFAHDVPLAAAFVGDDLWLATRGGAVRFPVTRAGADSGVIQLTDFDLHADQTLSADELRGRVPPGGLVLVRAEKAGPGLLARHASGAVLQRVTGAAGASWNPGDAADPAFIAACRVAEDPFWSWSKDGQTPLDQIHLTISATPPATLLQNGTWSFLETGQSARRGDPRRTMVYYRDSLYVATAGGVTRFPAPPGPDALRPADPKRFLDAVYAFAGDAADRSPLQDVVELLHEPATDQLYALREDKRTFRFDADRNEWSAVAVKDDPFLRARLLVDNRLLRWSLGDGGWELIVPPLLADLPDQSQYPLFHDGKFAFDDVRAVAAVGDQWWLATDGGVCTYDRTKFAPGEFFARALAPAPDALPTVREIVTDLDRPGRELCRCHRDDGSQAAFEYQAGQWKPTVDEAPFLACYERHQNELMRFVQYPFGVLEAYVADRTAAAGKAAPAAAILGTARGHTPLPLFAHQRFAFDDVQGAILDDDSLLVVTSAGLLERRVDWSAEQAPLTALTCYPSAGTKLPAMAWLVHLTSFPDGSLLAWSQQAVFRGTRAPAGAWQWNAVPGQSGRQLQDQMLLPDAAATWVLTREPSNNRLQLYQLAADATAPAPAQPAFSVGRSFHSTDVSTAVIDEQWIYQNNDPGGGVLRIPKAAIQ